MSNFHNLRGFGKTLHEEALAGAIDGALAGRRTNAGELQSGEAQVHRRGGRGTWRKQLSLKFSSHADFIATRVPEFFQRWLTSEE